MEGRLAVPQPSQDPNNAIIILRNCHLSQCDLLIAAKYLHSTDETTPLSQDNHCKSLKHQDLEN